MEWSASTGSNQHSVRSIFHMVPSDPLGPVVTFIQDSCRRSEHLCSIALSLLAALSYTMKACRRICALVSRASRGWQSQFRSGLLRMAWPSPLRSSCGGRRATKWGFYWRRCLCVGSCLKQSMWFHVATVEHLWGSQTSCAKGSLREGGDDERHASRKDGGAERQSGQEASSASKDRCLQGEHLQ